ncbi:MAG: hypothetical protein A2Z29_04700 [Chloroflexi bacterium RBG_16_56_11]|nr:MAG: hypothetical protein A2Z29_04700 [Chloroflexi bacterium RBG_16_56_11]
METDELKRLVNTLDNCRIALAEEIHKRESGNWLGRKPLNLPVNIICDALHNSLTVAEAARNLNVSRGYIYKYIPKPETYLKEHYVQSAVSCN